ncbi:adenosylcobinamide-GDP ribazoletransferase [Hydrogenoanaerobacterium sp.]|uniref:adenosylcobinamide-GDP ribazoletransferase n=1 Tax=Hydrogenoanaerobacterium sp. TaxID=2953763 RepID=UPI00289739B6|nr:adenosylcobinamide-GDP ribazoletransferase [Hydrogenoanaerobacterium sp.]
MKLLQPCIIAFAMYSKIPMPCIDWNKENMKYAMCFFPLVGAVLGALLYLWAMLTGLLHTGVILRAAICTLLPLLITGGIHLDGFCDTVDALSSRQSTERKLEILSDPHIGAFGVMGCTAYLLLSFALWAELTFTPKVLLILAIGSVLSRSLSGLSVVSFRCAKGSGLLAAFSDGAQKKNVRIVMLIFISMCIAAMAAISPIVGGTTAAAALLVFLYYRVVSYRVFGGITGDLAGWFLCLCELAMLAATVATGGLML